MSSEIKKKARVGRPKKIVPPGTKEIKFQVSAEVAAFIEASQRLSGEKYTGTFMANAIYAYADLLPRVEQLAADMEENRAMLAEILAGQRVALRFLADIERASVEEKFSSSNSVSHTSSIEDGQF